MEFVTYDTKSIEEASLVLLTLFSEYTRIEGAKQWTQAYITFQKEIQRQGQRPWTFIAEGLDLLFSGFTKPIPQIEKDKVVYKTREPRFVVEEKPYEVLPSKRAYIESVTDEIAMEMNEVYHLGITSQPLTLIFPKETYAQDIVLFDATVI